MPDTAPDPPPFIFRVPGELMRKFFQYLLPGLRDTGTLRYPFNQGDSSDLRSCRLVSRRFYDIATPLFWRRVNLVLPAFRNENTTTISQSRARLTKISALMSYIVQDREVHESVRLLSIVSNGTSYQEDTARRVALGLSSLITRLTNLRVLGLHDAAMLPSTVLADILLSPSLRAVRLQGIDFTNVSADRRLSNPNVKQLGIHRCRRAERLHSLMPSLRVFDGQMDDTSAAMPAWPSLEEASFQVDHPGWDHAARTFTAWRHSRRNLPLSLTELMICQWHFNPKIRDLDAIIRPFIGNPLTKLIVFYLEEPTTASLENIVRVFPKLKELSLLSDEELAHWPNDLETYGRTLSQLQDLQLLEWNYYDDGDGSVDVFGSWDVVSEERLGEIVLSLAETCSNLRKVNFCLVVDGLMEIAVARDSEGHTGTLPPVYCDSWVYCTSAWKPGNFSDI
ncbi:hypothetical protein M422DRAFT_64345 [Sphaerobolus stellatus SS14]|nr:hypothetical protein M422DRAFT_64345 [Sphaerobolus stellatus SS14]